ncbi:phospholipase D-like domain-containing protein [Runella salmonicolor]|uniref:Phospholipase D-like domain-containing protein n=1 Tax=Runella salmonicolor TaxID=2950278 RepID=A0ABT1FKL3_9BACT|nr:phospholipase D-like domain-containing protein [Runella salmonicolor]MCP1382299.1 phospholipase D-like domain-containing protein [Runella salmonicolor]
MRIIKTPWKNEFLDLVSQSQKSIKITSPFIKENICNELLLSKQPTTKLELITSFKLKNIHSGSLDLGAIENVLKNNGSVHSHPQLHSKLYIFDDKKLIITSGNLTNGGLMRNYEYGLLSTETSLIQEAINDFNLLLTSQKTNSVNLKNIKDVRSLLSKIAKTSPAKLPKFLLESPEEVSNIIELPENVMSSVLSGWKLEIYTCVDSLPNQIFTLGEMKPFEILLRTKFPNNNTIPAKIRQLLQQLRDMGMLEFLGNGKYKKLWK